MSLPLIFCHFFLLICFITAPLNKVTCSHGAIEMILLLLYYYYNYHIPLFCSIIQTKSNQNLHYNKLILCIVCIQTKSKR